MPVKFFLPSGRRPGFPSVVETPGAAQPPRSAPTAPGSLPRPRANVRPDQARTVHRYLLPIDAFVRIRQLERGAPPLRARPGLDRARYRRLVLETCCPELGPDPAAELARRCPEDALYQLCIEVNPSLDIHTVRLTDESEGPALDARPQESETPSREAARRRLTRRARGLGERLAGRVVGQPQAIAEVVSLVRRAAAGLCDERKPLG